MPENVLDIILNMQKKGSGAKDAIGELVTLGASADGANAKLAINAGELGRVGAGTGRASAGFADLMARADGLDGRLGNLNGNLASFNREVATPMASGGALATLGTGAIATGLLAVAGAAAKGAWDLGAAALKAREVATHGADAKTSVDLLKESFSGAGAAAGNILAPAVDKVATSLAVMVAGATGARGNLQLLGLQLDDTKTRLAELDKQAATSPFLKTGIQGQLAGMQDERLRTDLDAERTRLEVLIEMSGPGASSMRMLADAADHQADRVAELSAQWLYYLSIVNGLQNGTGSGMAGIGAAVVAGSRIAPVGYGAIPYNPVGGGYNDARSIFSDYGADRTPGTQTELAKYYQKLDDQNKATAEKAAAEWKAATNTMASDFKSAIQSVPGLFSTSSVTPEDMMLSKAGMYQPKADEYLRRLKAEVDQGKDIFPDVDIREAASRAGLDPSKDPKALYSRISQMWGTGELFANAANIPYFVDSAAVKNSLLQQKAGEQGRQNLFAAFGGSLDPAAQKQLMEGNKFLNAFDADAYRKSFMGKMDAELSTNKEQYQSKGSQLWDAIGTGFVGRAESDPLFQRAVDAMVTSAMTRAVKGKGQ